MVVFYPETTRYTFHIIKCVIGHLVLGVSCLNFLQIRLDVIYIFIYIFPIFCQCALGERENPFNSTECQPCPLMQFSNSVGSTQCLPCAGGFYSNSVGQSTCQNCPMGSAMMDAARALGQSFPCDICQPGLNAFIMIYVNLIIYA